MLPWVRPGDVAMIRGTDGAGVRFGDVALFRRAVTFMFTALSAGAAVALGKTNLQRRRTFLSDASSNKASSWEELCACIVEASRIDLDSPVQLALGLLIAEFRRMAISGIRCTLRLPGWSHGTLAFGRFEPERNFSRYFFAIVVARLLGTGGFVPD